MPSDTAAPEKTKTWGHDFKDDWHAFIAGSGLGFIDRTLDAGFYDRCAFMGNQEQWDALHALMGGHRVKLRGHEKASTTRAMQRIRTTAKRERA